MLSLSLPRCQTGVPGKSGSTTGPAAPRPPPPSPAISLTLGIPEKSESVFSLTTPSSLAPRYESPPPPPRPSVRLRTSCLRMLYRSSPASSSSPSPAASDRTTGRTAAGPAGIIAAGAVRRQQPGGDRIGAQRADADDGGGRGAGDAAGDAAARRTGRPPPARLMTSSGCKPISVKFVELVQHAAH